MAWCVMAMAAGPGLGGLPWQDGVMRARRFGARVAADARGGGVIVVPFDPDEAWGAKAAHHVNGTVNGCRVRVTVALDADG